MPDPERLSLPSLSVIGTVTVLPAAAVTFGMLKVTVVCEAADTVSVNVCVASAPAPLWAMIVNK